jgi:hypothetical protein
MRGPLHGHLLASGLALLALGDVALAHAAEPRLLAAPTTKEACFKSFESGQRQRKARQFLEASESFSVCARAECPGFVQKDCITWSSEVDALTPTVTLSALDEQGKDLFDVEVQIDAVVVASKLDGKAVRVNPGPHTVKFTAAGRTSIEERVLVKEGEKSRPVTATWKTAPNGSASSGSGSNSGSAGSTSGSGSGSATSGTSGVSSGPGIAPWILTAAGGAVLLTGLVLVVAAPSFPRECETVDFFDFLGDGKCGGTRDQTVSNRAASSLLMTRVGVGLMTLGGIAAASGVIWYFVASSSDAKADKSGLRILPSLGLGSLGVTGRF